VAIQEQLGADIQMVLDVCPPLPSPREVVRLAVERTAMWAARAAAAHRREGQALFGIVQGGADVAMRAESARRTVEIGFSGYGIGGLSVGETRGEMLPALEAATGELPSDRLRYLMGVGDPQSLVDSVALGVDLFDCVLPSRLGRPGTVLTDAGRINLRNARFARDDEPIDSTGSSPVSARYSRGYVRHLLATDEPTGRRLLTLHNVGWLVGFVERMRAAIEEQRFEAFRRSVHDTWGT
jgi:queuine tRNA-ribosyltransferase